MTKAGTSFARYVRAKTGREITVDSAIQRIARQVKANGLPANQTEKCMEAGVWDAIRHKKNPLARYPE